MLAVNYSENDDLLESFRCLYHSCLETYESDRPGIVNGQHNADIRRCVVAKSLVHHLDLARFIGRTVPNRDRSPPGPDSMASEMQSN